MRLREKSKKWKKFNQVSPKESTVPEYLQGVNCPPG